LLNLSLNDRQGKGYKIPENHFTWHAPAAIAVLVDALEAWLNETIRKQGFSDSEKLKLADNSIGFKHRELPLRFGGNRIEDQGDLNLLLDVRHEIVHFLPRDVKGDESVDMQVPSGLERLYEERIFFVPEAWAKERENLVITLDQFLCSYKLAYWAFECVERSVDNFKKACGEDERFFWFSSKNFESYKSWAWPPEQLSEYDRLHGLREVDSE
jgi:hypothetical protein